MARLIDFTDEELGSALHLIEGHEDGLEGRELAEWTRVKALILRAAQEARELNQ